MKKDDRADKMRDGLVSLAKTIRNHYKDNPDSMMVASEISTFLCCMIYEMGFTIKLCDEFAEIFKGNFKVLFDEKAPRGPNEK